MMSGIDCVKSTSSVVAALAPSLVVSVPFIVISPKFGCDWYERPMVRLGLGS
jgi:hypothetical protein